MRGLISFSVMMAVVAALYFGVALENHGLVMLVKVYCWAVIVCCLLVGLSKDVATKVFHGKLRWTQPVGVLVAFGVAIVLAYHGHWATGGALFLGEMLYLGAYFQHKDQTT